MREVERDVTAEDGVRLAVRAFDRPSADAPDLLLLHGLASSQHIWDLMLARLERRFRVVTYDARGHGRSEKPNSGFGFESVVDDARAVIRETQLRRPIVVGHSWGAMVALELGVAHPRAVAGIVLVDGGIRSLRSDMTWPEARIQLAPPHLAGMRIEDFRRRMPTFWGGAIDVTPEIEAIATSVMRVRRDGTIRPQLRRANHMKILRAIWAQDVVALHRRLRVPALGIVAYDDADQRRATSPAVDRVRATGSPVEISWIRGIHDLPLQHPEALCLRVERFAERAVR